MKLINNIESILDLLKFQEGIYYFVQIIKRKKDNPEMNKDSIQIYSKAVSSRSQLEKSLKEIVPLCDATNSRCYISLWPRSIEKYTYELNRRVADFVADQNLTKSVFRIPDSVALDSKTVLWKGVYKSSLCMLDIDLTNIDEFDPILRKYLQDYGIEPLCVLPSVNGYHYICEFFYPGNTRATRVSDGPDMTWEIDGGVVFTFCKDLNTVLYARLED